MIGCSNSQQSAQEKIDKNAKDIKPELPKMLDAETKLVNVYTKKLEIVSEYELLKLKAGDGDNQKTKDKIERYLKNKSAMLHIPRGNGNIVLFGFRPQFRGQPRGTYKLIFNSIYLGAKE